MNDDNDKIPAERDIVLPKFPEKINIEGVYKPEPVLMGDSGQGGDYDDIIAIDRAIESVRSALFKINNAIRVSERKEVIAKLEYERRFARAYLTCEGRTDAVKKSIAQITVEEYENTWVIYQQYSKELTRQARLMNNEFEALKMLSYNIRKEIDASR
jgi:hypothetical protein